MGANEVIAVVRFILMLYTIITFLVIYKHLRFSGFLALIGGILCSILTLAMVETHIIEPTGSEYEVLLLWMSVMYLIGALLIYKALKRYLCTS